MTRTIAGLVLLALLGSGCVVLPRTQTTTRDAGTEPSKPTYGQIKETKLHPASSRTDVRVRAINTRECQRQIYAVTEVTKAKRTKLGVDDPRGRAVGVLFAPVTIPISVIITGIVIASSDKDIQRVKRPLRSETFECTTNAAGLALEFQYPSGHIYRGKTGANGELISTIPIDEPYSGDVEVRGADLAAQVHYEQKVPAVTVARDAVEACRGEHQVTSLTLKLTINERGFATRLWLSVGDQKLAACVSKKIAGVVFPRNLRSTTVVLPFEAPTT